MRNARIVSSISDLFCTGFHLNSALMTLAQISRASVSRMAGASQIPPSKHHITHLMSHFVPYGMEGFRCQHRGIFVCLRLVTSSS
jgi:hypothetical protein